MNQPEANFCGKYRISCSACSLKELCLPRGLSAENIIQLESVIKRRRPVNKGEYIYHMDDPCHSLFTVRSGSVKSLVLDNNGVEQVVGFHLPGELFGLDGLETDIHSCSAIALEPASVCELPLEQIDKLYSSIPGLGYQINRLIGQEVASDHEMLMLLGKKDARKRLSNFLINLSKRFRERGFSEKEFNLSMSRKDVGNYLGLALETVSRQLSSFQELGVITVKRRQIIVHDMERLKAMSTE